jgi:2-C-methyl-D-erythritol 2,4-cyclodiphosphate synthase
LQDDEPRHDTDFDRLELEIRVNDVQQPKDQNGADPEFRTFPEFPHRDESLDCERSLVNVQSEIGRDCNDWMMRFRVGQGFDFHPLEKGRRLILGGVEIAHSHGLRGHSDADVAAHALANAILGALGEGDLGRHFPDNDARYKDADSLDLLATVWKRAADLGWRLGNADVTIFAQLPKLAPHLDEMRKRMTAAIGVEEMRANVKASNPEGLGAIGRGEGMAASAVVLLEAD